MVKITKEIIVNNKQGLHARPAAIFVQIVSRYNSSVTLEKDKEKVNGRSIMGILTLGVQPGVKITLNIDGDDADQVCEELEALLTKDTIE